MPCDHGTRIVPRTSIVTGGGEFYGANSAGIGAFPSGGHEGSVGSGSSGKRVKEREGGGRGGILNGGKDEPRGTEDGVDGGGGGSAGHEGGHKLLDRRRFFVVCALRCEVGDHAADGAERRIGGGDGGGLRCDFGGIGAACAVPRRGLRLRRRRHGVMGGVRAREE